MVDSTWTTILGAAIPTVVSLLVVFSTRERSSGKDHSLVSQTARDVETMKAAFVDVQSTLATHKSLHSQALEMNRTFDTRLRAVEREQAEATGREDGRRHTNR